MAEGRKVTPVDLELEEPAGRFEGMTLREAREALERDMILRVLARHKDNITRAAEELGISRPTLYELMEKLGIGRKVSHKPQATSSKAGPQRGREEGFR